MQGTGRHDYTLYEEVSPTISFYISYAEGFTG